MQASVAMSDTSAYVYQMYSRPSSLLIPITPHVLHLGKPPKLAEVLTYSSPAPAKCEVLFPTLLRG
jgi:hypothetical protein